MNILPNKLLYRTLLVLLFLFTNFTKSFSQTDTSFGSIKKSLLTIIDPVIKQTYYPENVCNPLNGLTVDKLFEKALASDSKGNWQCCLKILNSISDKSIKLTPFQQCRLHLAWAKYYTLHQNYHSAYAYAALAGKAADEHKWKNEKAEELLLLSEGNLKQRNISFAYEYADSALIIAKEIGNENLEGRVLFQFALCTRRHFTAFAKRSFPYFLMAREKAIATNDLITQGNIDLYLLSDYVELKKWGEGLPYFKEAIPIAMHGNNVYQLYLAYVACGYTFEETKNFWEALILFKKALKLSEYQKQPYNIEHCYHDIAICYEGLREYDSALVYANLASTVPGVDSFFSNIWDTKATIYNDLGNYKMAAAMYKKSVDWFNEVFLYLNQNQLSVYEAKLNTKQKELQVSQQKKRAVQLEWLIGATAGLLIIAAWAFAVQRRARTKLFLQNKLIQRQQRELERSLNEKELLLKEIHHRVKNNLSVISSLLELQSNGISDEAANAAIAVAQNRISSIALIHQRLYQHGNLDAIELREFLHVLSKQVSSVYKKQDTQIQIDIAIPETLLDIDTAVPLGLIMNELLTNSFKYAFNLGKQGVIKFDMQEQSPGDFLLTYSDNGSGIHHEIDIQKSASLGLRLIQRLSKQLGGSAVYEYRQGSIFVINFKTSKTRNQEWRN